MGVAAGAGAADASGLGFCAWLIAAPARNIPATASERQRTRIVSSFS